MSKPLLPGAHALQSFSRCMLRRTQAQNLARNQNQNHNQNQNQCQRVQSASFSLCASPMVRREICRNGNGVAGGYGRAGGYGVAGGYGRAGGYGVAGGRSFSGTSGRLVRTVEEQKSRYKSGPFSWRAGLLFLSSGAGLIFYFRYEKDRMERKRVAEAAKGVGKPKVGGPFELVDQDGGAFTDGEMRGKYSLVYFGFSHCPDICPEELDKMATMIDLVRASPAYTSTSPPPPLLPLFITCDPARDTPGVLKEYLAEFHKDIIGLTGSWDAIKDVCKKYRVYFSTPADVKQGQDYLVDHSIYFYLMDPEGDFVEAIGRQHSPEEAARIILGHVGDWKR